ncbi:programmed cell death protein 2 [Drosophila grimshawi]|uniref:GH19974 n=1 Tax=Drosophila grimshawi TaxID=7222 RepID=B4J8D2_DROGR|nr:programmed cell death protein 2 [Drosophila grimshawi]EDW02291.1 GH19974 [Drosophila grimshawi]
MAVDLGFAEQVDNTAWLSNRYFPSKLGGRPAWLELDALPATAQLQCQQCQAPQAFLCQLYAPKEDEFNFHRSIYVFLCRNPDCQQPNKAHNFKVLRSQLPLKNRFYSDQSPSEEGEPLPAIDSLKKLCAACGCLGPHTCSRCKSINYCSSTHQRAHWPLHKPNCGIDKAAAANKALPQLQFPEYEIVESDPTSEPSAVADKDEATCLAEFEQLSANGKAGELSDVPERELDKYFGSSAAAEDKSFEHFKQLTAAHPEQVVRYRSGAGAPLWIANVENTIASQLAAVPNCSHCGSVRQFEFQIMPQMLTLLNDERLDWGILAVYTCARSCPIDGYVEEHIIKQDIVA